MDSDDCELDPLFDLAISFVVENQRASISGVQRQLRIGYNRAARLIEKMEEIGVVSEPGKDGNRTVLLSDISELDSYRASNKEDQSVDMSNVITWPGRKK